MTENDRLARIIWLRYYVDTEEFDRTLPGRMSQHGGWLVHPGQRGESYAFAHRCCQAAREECERNGLSRFSDAPLRASLTRLSHERQLEELETLLDKPYRG